MSSETQACRDCCAHVVYLANLLHEAINPLYTLLTRDECLRSREMATFDPLAGSVAFGTRPEIRKEATRRREKEGRNAGQSATVEHDDGVEVRL